MDSKETKAIISTSINKELKEAMEAISQRTDISVAHHMRKALREYVERNKA